MADTKKKPGMLARISRALQNLRSPRTEDTRKAAQLTSGVDVSHMMTPAVRQQADDTPAAKQPERKAPEVSVSTLGALAAEIKRREDEKKRREEEKKKSKTTLTGKK